MAKTDRGFALSITGVQSRRTARYLFVVWMTGGRAFMLGLN